MSCCASALLVLAAPASAQRPSFRSDRSRDQSWLAEVEKSYVDLLFALAGR